MVSEGAGGGWVTSAQLTHHMPKTPDTTQATAQCLATHPLSTRLLTQTHVITVISKCRRRRRQRVAGCLSLYASLCD